MSIKAKLSSLGMTAAVLAFTASGSWAANTVCNTVYGPYASSTDPVNTTIAVASNFYSAAQDFVNGYQASSDDRGATVIRICQNSTAHLLTEIKTGTGLPSELLPDPGSSTTRYGIFFAANAAAPDELANSLSLPSYSYAKGLPVYFTLSSSISNVGQLMPSLATTTDPNRTLDRLVTSADAIDTTNAALTTVAVADPTAAPYGLAATTILYDMGLVPSTTGFTPPSWMHALYANIDLTLTSVTPDNINKSGFVSKAQICTILSSAKYIAFTNAHYVLNQKAILLNTSNTVASDLNSYLTGQLPPATGWNTFLTAHCYGTL